MAHSTADIPPDLLLPSQSTNFLAWVRALQVPTSKKRYLISTWRKTTQAQLSKTDYDFALGKEGQRL